MSAESKVAAPVGGVDVLAAIEDSINECNDVTCPQCRRLAKARAAVAELVAAIETDATDRAISAGLGASEWRSCVPPHTAAALARVQGGAA